MVIEGKHPTFINSQRCKQPPAIKHAGQGRRDLRVAHLKNVVIVINQTIHTLRSIESRESGETGSSARLYGLDRLAF